MGVGVGVGVIYFVGKSLLTLSHHWVGGVLEPKR